MKGMLTYEQAREWARKNKPPGIKHGYEFQNWVSKNKHLLPKGFPLDINDFYARRMVKGKITHNGWKGWGDFLGIVTVKSCHAYKEDEESIGIRKKSLLNELTLAVSCANNNPTDDIKERILSYQILKEYLISEDSSVLLKLIWPSRTSLRKLLNYKIFKRSGGVSNGINNDTFHEYFMDSFDIVLDRISKVKIPYNITKHKGTFKKWFENGMQLQIWLQHCESVKKEIITKSSKGRKTFSNSEYNQKVKYFRTERGLL
jgi:hypothetical protein